MDNKEKLKIILFFSVIIHALCVAYIIYDAKEIINYEKGHSLEVTSICQEYAKADKVDYDVLKKTYTFNDFTVDETILLASCKS